MLKNTASLTLVVDNTRRRACEDGLLDKAVRAYWNAVEERVERAEAEPNGEDAAVAFLTPLRTQSPRGLAQKVEILERLVGHARRPEQIARLAASIAHDALSMSRSYLPRA